MLRTCALISLSVALLATAPASAQSPAPAPGWKEVDQLLSEQKVQAALDATLARLKTASGKSDEAEWARALIRATQLQLGLHGYETAVRFLREQPWPKGVLQRAALDLYYAHALVTYGRVYGWEIRQREKVESKGAVDLKAWTLEQIHAQAQRAFDDVWARRAELGTQKVEALKEHLVPGNYPPGIRDTLRDAVSYLRVELLADTSAWRPEQSNELYKLDLAALLRGDPTGSAKLALSDPNVHPLLRLLAVLDDLEAWHAAAGRKEAALEARLERYRRLSASFPDAQDQAAIEKDLAASAEKARGLPWYAMAKATLAELVRGRDPVKARQLALEGQKAFPQSVGGQRCAFLVASIEAPDYSLAHMNVDALGKRSVEVTHKNLKALYFRAYPVDLERRISEARDYNLLPSGQELRALLRTKAEVEWTEELPATPDYQHHRTYVVPKLSRPGLYVIAASARPDYAEVENRLLSVAFIASDLVLSALPEAGAGYDVHVWSGSAGQPVPGAEVRLYRYDWQKKHQLVETQTSDAHGAVRFKFDPTRSQQSYFLAAKKGADVTLDASYTSFPARYPNPDAYGTLVYTDRSIYRPLQKLFWKAVVFKSSREGARYDAVTNDKVTLSLVDPNGEVVATQSATTNAFGSAAGEFTVPTGRLLGTWTVASSRQGTSSIRVEEYKRPTFEVSLKDPEGALRLNRPASLTGEARYYFGLPVVAGKVRWKVNREPVFPWWWGYYYREAPNAGAQQVAAGTSELQADGSFKVQFTPEADERRASKDVSYRYRLSVDVTDEGGETRSANKGFRLGWVSVEARVQLDETFLVAGEDGAALIVRSNLDGVPRAGAGSYRLLAVEQPAQPLLPADEPALEPPAGEGAPKFLTAGDKLRSRAAPGYAWEATVRRWKDGKELARGALTHDAKGEAQVPLQRLAPGLYRLKYETLDESGAKFETSKELLVVGKGLTLSLPALFLVQRSMVKVGQPQRLLAYTGFAGQQLIVEAFRGDRRVERRYLKGGEDNPLLELPVTEADRGGISWGALVIRDHQAMPFNGTVYVPWDDKELKVELATFRDKIRPGAQETWRVTVKGATGKRETAPVELLAYMYDQSLDLFAPHAPPSVLSLYPNRMSSVWQRTNLGGGGGQWISSSVWPRLPPYPQLTPDRLIYVDSYGLGGPGGRYRGSPMSLAMPSPAPKLEGANERDSRERKKAKDSPAEEPAQAPAAQALDRLAATTPAPAAPEAPLRQNFSETAFWKPQLLLSPEGDATLEFKVPDSVTAWNVWVHALTRDLRGGSTTRKTQSVKELMIRPYVPRFLREGDQAVLKVVVNNASEQELKGSLALELLDPETNQRLDALFKLANATRSFSVAKQGSASFEFTLTAPRELRTVAVKAVASAGGLSDGELRPVPVLPSRMHLAQSKFVTLRNKDRRELTFADLAKADDPTRINEQLVVTVDAQLFYTVLQALPYLVTYPYECTEQTLNRFVSTGIVSSVYKSYPAVAQLAKQLSARKTPLETFDAADPNRKLALEESPWLVEARGGGDPTGMANVLDPRVAAAEREASLAKLRKAQTANGAFPWFPGGPPSPYMTLYILHGFAKAAEFGVDVPKDVIQRGWQYLAQHYRSEYATKMLREDCCWEFLTFLNYVASSYPDASYTGDALTLDERKKLLDHGFRHWKQHSPYLKGYLALTLKRMGRPADAKLVFDSVMDSAKTTQDEGTFWAPEDRGWLWYNDTIETHAFALRTLMELSPADARRDGLVQWLLLNKKLNQWKSTRATAEVIYSLVKYLEKEGALGIREAATVKLGARTVDFVFEPDKYTGKKNQIVVEGPQVTPELSTVVVSKESKGFMFASATWHFSTDKLPTEERGDLFRVSRRYFKRERQGRETVLRPMADGQQLIPGDELEVQLSIRAKAPAEYVHLRDPRAAGLEPENAVSRYRWDLGLAWYEETRDSATNFFFESLPQGEYTLKYRLRVNMGGTFRVGPATLQSMYAPEFTAYSTGTTVSVAPR